MPGCSALGRRSRASGRGQGVRGSARVGGRGCPGQARRGREAGRARRLPGERKDARVGGSATASCGVRPADWPRSRRDRPSAGTRLADHRGRSGRVPDLTADRGSLDSPSAVRLILRGGLGMVSKGTCAAEAKRRRQRRRWRGSSESTRARCYRRRPSARRRSGCWNRRP